MTHEEKSRMSFRSVAHHARRAMGAAAALAVVAAATAMVAEAPQGAPAFTVAQASDGQKVYGESCAACHGPSLEGGAGPALTGAQFRKAWIEAGRSVGDFFEVVSHSMPQNAPGSLPRDQYLAVTAYVLAKNDFPAGTEPLALANLDRRLAFAGADRSAAPATRPDGPPRTFPTTPDTVGQASTSAPSDAELREVKDGDWLHYNRTYAGHRFSPLTEINTGNVGKLTPRCMVQLGEIGSFETSPIVYHGRMFVTTNHKTFAIDGATCKLLWSDTYVPSGPEHIPSNRGMALYRGMLFRGTTDSHLLALDAVTGKRLWDVTVGDATRGYFVSGAPMAFDGMVYVGEGGADHGIKGHIHAFDAATGRSRWQFDVIPTGDQSGAESWSAGQETGGGSSWSSMAVDPDRKLLFVPTGNPGPDFNAASRRGDNLYTDSVVVLDAATGGLKWFVQQVPADIHDWDTAAAPAIYQTGGKEMMAVASKNGFLILYDRRTHKVIAQAETMTRENADVPFSFDHPVRYCPGGLGQWNGPAFSPRTGMLYVGSAERCDSIQLAQPKYVKGQLFFGGLLRTSPNETATGWVRGIDAATGKQAWAYKSPSSIVAGVTPTAGGLLLTGDGDGWFLVFDARTGRQLYRFMTGGGIGGGITTYTAGGRQLIAVPTGNSSRGTWHTTGSATVMVFGVDK